MTSVEQFLLSPWAIRLGWALLHSIWQIAAAGAFVAIALWFSDRRYASLRYLVACSGLAAMLAAPTATYWLVTPSEWLEIAAVSAPPSEGGATGTTPEPPSGVLPLESTDPHSQPVAAETLDQSPAAEAETPLATAPTTPAQAPATPGGISAFLAPYVPWIVLAWAAGVAALSIWHGGGYIAVGRLRHRGVAPAPASLEQRFEQLRGRLLVTRPVRLVQSILVEVPAAIGWLRPVVLVPAGVITGLAPQQIDAILAHELAHIRRRDYLVNLLQTIAETLLFYHPAVWWISRRMRIEREHCCDDLAVAACGARVEYAAAIAALEQHRALPRAAVAASARSGGATLQRVRRILGAAEPATRPWESALGSGLAAAFVAIVVAVACGHLGRTSQTALAAEDEPVAKELARMPLTKTYDVGGLKVEAGFLPDEREIMLGQPSFVTFTVTNRGDRPYRFAIGGDIRGSVRHNNFRITAVDAEGRPVKDPYSYNHFGGPTPEINLQPGQIHKERLYLGHWLAFARPGVYTVTCQRTLQDLFGPAPRHPDLPVETKFELKVLPYDREKMGQVIARCGRDVREGGEQQLRDATLALADIDDPEVIPHLAASLRRGDYQNRIPAVNGLKKFSTDAAGEALLGALKDPDHAVREAAGRALRETKQVKRVVQTLLKNLADPAPEVRQSAATALGQSGAPAAVDALIKSLDDAVPGVARAAAVSLGDLGDRRASEPLHRRLHHPDGGLRVAAADGLRRLTGKLDPAWLTPVIRETTDINDQAFHESIRLIRVYSGTAAAPALIGCLRFDDPSPKGHYNFFLILAIHHAEKGPDCYYRWKHDPNTDGTPEQIANNRKILEELKAWAAQRAGEAVPPARDGAGDRRPKHRFALYRVLGHRNARPFGAKENAGKGEILFSDEGDGSRRFDSMRPEDYPLKGLILDQTPLLTEADVVGYVWPKHEVHLKPDARDRLLRAIKPSVWGVPFAIVAEGEPAYLGAFWTAVSSYLANMPTISVDGWQWTVPEPDGLPKNAIRIELSQVRKPGDPPATDPRESPRLREALKRAGKLLDNRPGAELDGAGKEHRDLHEPGRPATDPAWGDAVDGVQLRVRAEKSKWPEGTIPKLLADFRNRGQRDLGIRIDYLSWQIEIDGKWFESDVGWGARRIVLPLEPGTLQRDLEVLIHPDDARGRALRTLPAGKHTLRVARLLPSAAADARSRLRVVSNPVEIETVAEKDKDRRPGTEPPPKGFAPASLRDPAGEPAGIVGEKAMGETVFVPVVERILTTDIRKASSFLDLDTGQYVDPPLDGVRILHDQLRQKGIDLYLSGAESMANSRTAADMGIGQLWETAWDDSARWTPREARINIARILEGRQPSAARVITAPGTFVFRTREGSIGLLRLIGPTEARREVIAQYKLLREPGHLRADRAGAAAIGVGGNSDAGEVLKRLKSADAVYERGFTASGMRPGWPNSKWTLTMLGGETVYEEQVVDIPKPAEDRIGRFISFRRTFYWGPKAQVEHDWVGRIQGYGPVGPWPDNSPGPATGVNLDVARPDAATYLMFLRRPVLSLGRGYSRHITDIKEVTRQEDGRLKVIAGGLDIACRPGAKWELLVEPDAAYLVRSAKVVDEKNRTMSFVSSGLKRYGARYVPEKAQCKGAFADATFEIQSASAEADAVFLKRVKAAMRPPYPVRTDVHDRRADPALYMPYAAGKTSPQGRRKDWDLGLDDATPATGDAGAAAKQPKATSGETAPDPKSAKLLIRYDIPGADVRGQFRLELMTWEMKDAQKPPKSVQTLGVPNGGELLVTGLTSGPYDLARIRNLRGGSMGTDAFCDRRLGLRLPAGETTVIDFIRKTGHPLTGQVVGLPQERLRGTFVFVRDARATANPKRMDEWKLATFDGVVTDAQGRFTTSRIPPGTYAVVANSFPERRGDQHGMGWLLPDFVGSAKVTVPEQGAPPEVRIAMKTLADFQRNVPAENGGRGDAQTGAWGETSVEGAGKAEGGVGVRQLKVRKSSSG